MRATSEKEKPVVYGELMGIRMWYVLRSHRPYQLFVTKLEPLKRHLLVSQMWGTLHNHVLDKRLTK